jgi:hypothetical protein
MVQAITDYMTITTTADTKQTFHAGNDGTAQHVIASIRKTPFPD